MFDLRLYVYRGGPRDGLEAWLKARSTANGLVELVTLTSNAFHTYRSKHREEHYGPSDPVVVDHCPEYTRARPAQVDY